MQLLEHFKELTVHPKNVSKLYDLILQFGIEGKLTKAWREQNPTKHSKDDINESIQNDIQLFRKRKRSRNSIIPESIESIDLPYETADSWNWFRIGEIIDIVGGSQPPKGKFIYTESEGYTRLVQIRDFKSDLNKVYVPTELAKRPFNEEDIMIGRYGPPVFQILRGLSGTYNVALMKATPMTKQITKDYLFYLLKEPRIQKIIIDESERTAGQSGLRKPLLDSIPISIPSLEEQKAIVATVNQLFKEVEALEEQTKATVQLKQDFVTSALQELATGDTVTEWSFLQEHFKTFFTEKSAVKKLRESILQLAVQGKLTKHWRESRKLSGQGVESATVLLERIKTEKEQLIIDKKIKKEKPLPEIPEEEIPYALPEGWVWCRMQSIFKDLRYGTSKKCGYGLGSNPVLRIPNIKNGQVDMSDLKTTNLSAKEIADLSLSEGDMLIIRSNGSESIVGRTAVISSVGIGSSFAGYLMRLQIFNNDIDCKYLHTVLETPMLRRLIEGPLRTTSGVKNINSTEVSRLIIPLPPFEEQKAIVEKVNALMGLCDRLEQEIEHSTTQVEQLMQSCLKEVFEG